jgi:hypothetical protein
MLILGLYLLPQNAQSVLEFAGHVLLMFVGGSGDLFADEGLPSQRHYLAGLLLNFLAKTGCSGQYLSVLLEE